MPANSRLHAIYKQNVQSRLTGSQDQKLASRFIEFWESQIGARQSPANYQTWMSYLTRTVHLSFGTNPNSSAADQQMYAGCYSELAKESREVLSALCDYKLPPRYVSREMSLAWQKTKVPKLNWNNPYVLPGYVCFSPCSTKEKPPEFFADSWYIESLMVIHKPNGLMVYMNSLTFDAKAGLYRVAPHAALLKPDIDYNTLEADDGLRMMALLAINSWLIHAHEPELIEHEALPMRGGFGRKPGRPSPIAPTWIGRNFKIRRESSPASGQETGIKVRPHWRSGHWHTVRHGEGRQQERLQWYRPVYVNADPAS